MTKEQLAEESMIDLAYAVLAENGEHLTLRQLMDEVRKLNGVTVREMTEKLPRVNTDINIDGRFLAIDDIRWGLREWYPVDQLEAESAPVVRTRRKKKSAEDDEEEDFIEVDEDGFDIIDGEEDEDLEDEELDEAVDEDIEEDEEDIDVDLLDEDEEIPEDIVLDEDEEEEDDEEEEEL